VARSARPRLPKTETYLIQPRPRRHLLGLLLSALVCCDRAATAPAPGPAPASSEAGAFDLVYERVKDGNQDLYLTAAGGVEKRLTDDPATDGLPRFTPDGGKILFTSDRAGNYQIWEIPAAGGDARRIRTNRFTEWQVDLSPDGKRLAFLSNQDGPEALFVMDLDKGQAELLVRHGNSSILGNPDWSADGKRIVFSSNWRVGHQIYLVDVATHEVRRLSGILRGACEPRFHPDGRRVAYVSRGHHSDQSRLVEQDVDSGEQRVLVDWPALNYDPVYSPDGSEVAFASNITGEYAIYRQRLSDGKSWRVTNGPGLARNPDYRPRRP
jgi:Tol biopolymer transport system component